MELFFHLEEPKREKRRLSVLARLEKVKVLEVHELKRRISLSFSLSLSLSLSHTHTHTHLNSMQIHLNCMQMHAQIFHIYWHSLVDLWLSVFQHSSGQWTFASVSTKHASWSFLALMCDLQKYWPT